MANHVLADYQNKMLGLQADLQSRKDRNQGVGSVLRKIKRLRHKIMRIQRDEMKKS